MLAALSGLAIVAMIGLPRLMAQEPSASLGAATGATAPADGSPGGRSEPTETSMTGTPVVSTPVPAHSPSTPRTAATPATPRSTSMPLGTPVATPSPSGHPGAAPASADEFDLDSQVIAIEFPVKEGARYQYRDNFLDRRDGEAHGYNHARIRRGDRLLRAHDGTDIYAAQGAPVVAPFDGVVIDPTARWEPWIPDRYGRTAVIESTEPTSDGYTAILSHLSAVFVEPGQQVHRGEVVGLVGATGNAEGGRPHLHFELRAPFALSWQQVGEDRLIDAFNPYPSLRAADPKQRN